MTSLEDGKFKVKGKTVHTVDFGMSVGEPSCSCKDWLKPRIPCKHFFAVFRIHPEWSWEQFPQAYLDSSYLSLDTAAVEQYVGKVDHPSDSVDMQPAEDQVIMDVNASDSVDMQPAGDQVIMDVSSDEEASGTERSNMNEIPRKVKLQCTCTHTTKSRVLTTNRVDTCEAHANMLCIGCNVRKSDTRRPT